MKQPSVCIVGGDSYGFNAMFVNFGWRVTRMMDEADMFQFTGGADVSPHLYGEAPHPRTHTSPARDESEVHAFNVIRKMGKPMAGICRGGQFLNVMNGGAMFQHVDAHTRSHEIFTPDGERICFATSTHHQMMIPSKDAEIIAIANESSQREYMDKGGPQYLTGAHDDTEVVYYDATKSLCFQPHPEIASIGGPLQRFYFECIRDYLGIDSPSGLIGNEQKTA